MSTDARPPSVETLPVELLSRIFLIVKGNQDRDWFDHDAYGSSPPAAEVCSQVSAYFRNVALHCSLLWTTVTIKHGTQPDCVQAYCSRSTPSPLIIRVDLEKARRTKPRHMDRIFDTLSILLPQVYRWQALSIHLGFEAIAGRSVVAFLCTSPAPCLEFLSLSISEVDRLDPTVAWASPAAPTIFTRSTDAISFLRLRGLAIHAFRPPLARLTVLHLDGTSPIPIAYDAFSILLNAIARLRHLSLYGDAVCDWPSTYNALAVISLPSLESIRIHSVDGSGFEGLIMNIDAPSLLSVTLQDMLEDDLTCDRRRPNVPISFPQVTELTFCNFDLSEVNFHAIFRMFPSTQTFRSEGKTIGISKIYAALSGVNDEVTASGRVEWPHLHTLHMGFDGQDDSWLIEALVDSRREMGCPLAHLEFTSPEDYGGEKAVNDWLAEARSRDDFDVEVTTRGSGEILWPPHPHSNILDREDDLFY